MTLPQMVSMNIPRSEARMFASPTLLQELTKSLQQEKETMSNRTISNVGLPNHGAKVSDPPLAREISVLGDMAASSLPLVEPPRRPNLYAPNTFAHHIPPMKPTRAKRACVACNKSKVACKMLEGGKTCQRCSRKGMECVLYTPKPVSQTRKKKKKKPKQEVLKDKFGKTVKRLKDSLNKHKGKPCQRKPYCVRPFKHPGHCGECKCPVNRPQRPHICNQTEKVSGGPSVIETAAATSSSGIVVGANRFTAEKSKKQRGGTKYGDAKHGGDPSRPASLLPAANSQPSLSEWRPNPPVPPLIRPNFSQNDGPPSNVSKNPTSPDITTSERFTNKYGDGPRPATTNPQTSIPPPPPTSKSSSSSWNDGNSDMLREVAKSTMSSDIPMMKKSMSISSINLDGQEPPSLLPTMSSIERQYERIVNEPLLENPPSISSEKSSGTPTKPKA
eukprot:jgi/Bigna1/67576/fgenesh1_pg.4_\